MELSDEWPRGSNPLRGKFVRLGEVILLGTTIDYGPAEWFSEKRRYLKHVDMAWHGNCGMGDAVTARIRETAPEDEIYLRKKWPLVDAGESLIRLDTAGSPYSLTLNEDSTDFGRPDKVTRQKTGELARVALGPDFIVTVE